MKRLIIIVPCYNEEESFSRTNTVLNDVLIGLVKRKKISSNSSILYVDDGSKDGTWSLIQKEYKKNNRVCAIKFASNKGHQNAVYAGLMYAKDLADVTITIDADLQDDVNVIEEMVDKYNKGAQVVYGVRNDRTTDSFFKKTSAKLFYEVIKNNGSKAVANAADFRLLSSDVLKELFLYNEYHLYLRGIAPELGYKQECVYYKRLERTQGVSKYPLKKMIKLAVDGITSCNDSPLFSFYYLSFSTFVVALLMLVLFFIKQNRTSGFAISYFVYTLIFIILGFVLFGIATLGQYIGRTFMESKKRPRYYIEQILDRRKR